MPHPFTWVPAAQARHASTDAPPAGHSYPTGTEVTTLCGREVTADNGELAWLWRTCPTCHASACRTAGVDAPTAPEAGKR